MRSDMDHPMMALEYRSMNTHRYNHPSRVGIAVMAETHFWFASETENSRLSRFGEAMVLRESVVTLNRRRGRGTRPALRISVASCVSCIGGIKKAPLMENGALQLMLFLYQDTLPGKTASEKESTAKDGHQAERRRFRNGYNACQVRTFIIRDGKRSSARTHDFTGVDVLGLDHAREIPGLGQKTA